MGGGSRGQRVVVGSWNGGLIMVAQVCFEECAGLGGRAAQGGAAPRHPCRHPWVLLCPASGRLPAAGLTPDAVLLSAGGVAGDHPRVVVACVCMQGGRTGGQHSLKRGQVGGQPAAAPCAVKQSCVGLQPRRSARPGCALHSTRLPAGLQPASQAAARGSPCSFPPGQVWVPLLQGTSFPEYMRSVFDQFLPATEARASEGAALLGWQAAAGSAGPCSARQLMHAGIEG